MSNAATGGQELSALLRYYAVVDMRTPGAAIRRFAKATGITLQTDHETKGFVGVSIENRGRVVFANKR
jgi:hypothetical protein